MPIGIGLDLGARFVKGVMQKSDGTRTFQIARVGTSYQKTAERICSFFFETHEWRKGEAVICVTGCGATSIKLSHDFSAGETACLTAAMRIRKQGACTVLDFGGQAGRVYQFDELGRLCQFSATSNCAAGSGIMLENVARVLGVSLKEMGELSQNAEQPVKFTTGCAVFAESEAITAVALGEKKADILAGCHAAIAAKISAMTGPYLTQAPLFAIGGGALDDPLVQNVAILLDKPIEKLDRPQFVLAIGAADMALGHF